MDFVSVRRYWLQYDFQNWKYQYDAFKDTLIIVQALQNLGP